MIPRNSEPKCNYKNKGNSESKQNDKNKEKQMQSLILILFQIGHMHSFVQGMITSYLITVFYRYSIRVAI